MAEFVGRKGARKQSLECGVNIDNQQVWGCSSFSFLTQVESFLNMLYLCKQTERRNNTDPHILHMLCGNIKIPTSFLSIYASLNSFCCVGVTGVFASYLIHLHSVNGDRQQLHTVFGMHAKSLDQYR